MVRCDKFGIVSDETDLEEVYIDDFFYGRLCHECRQKLEDIIDAFFRFGK